MLYDSSARERSKPTGFAGAATRAVGSRPRRIDDNLYDAGNAKPAKVVEPGVRSGNNLLRHVVADRRAHLSPVRVAASRATLTTAFGGRTGCRVIGVMLLEPSLLVGCRIIVEW